MPFAGYARILLPFAGYARILLPFVVGCEKGFPPSLSDGREAALMGMAPPQRCQRRGQALLGGSADPFRGSSPFGTRA